MTGTLGKQKGKGFLIGRTAYLEFESELDKEKSKEMHMQMFKNRMLKVEDKIKEIPAFLGRREKCYNVLMDNYFTSTKNNFGPIKIKKSLRKRYEPY